MTGTLYRTLWRWHFYAGLFVMPMVLLLALTGSLFLFKPQIDAFEERAWRGLATAPVVSADAQVAAALAAFPGARLHAYRLPAAPGDAALVHVGPVNGGMRDVFVAPDGRVLGALDPDQRLMAVVQRLHGQLLLGPAGSWLVELAASWAIVMIITGLVLWSPRRAGLAGVLWPRFGAGGRLVWRDLHAVAGFWVAGLALVLLLTGLPWADAWGRGFKAVRAELGWVKGRQDWTIGGRPASDAGPGTHAEHGHQAMLAMATAAAPAVTLAQMVEQARARQLAWPALVKPGAAGGDGWTVQSESQNRPLRVTLVYGRDGRLLRREGFADKHPIDQVIGYGVAWHEGQLFGWVNQLIGLTTALLLVTLSVTGFVMWRRRKPADRLGAPPPSAATPRRMWLVPVTLALALLLPLLGVSLLVLLAFDQWLLPRLPGFAHWLGARPPTSGP